MRKFVILSLFALGTLSLYAQAEFKQTKYPNGNIKMEGYFENGNPVGVMKRYHENGIIQGIQIFASDGTSKAEIYAGDGTLSARGKYGEVLGDYEVHPIKKRNDFALWLQVLRDAPYCAGMPEILAYYRIRSNSVTTSSKKFQLVKYHWDLYRNYETLVKRETPWIPAEADRAVIVK